MIADFPAGQSFLDFHVAEVTPDDGLLVIVNHAGNLSSLYISDVVSEYEVNKWKFYDLYSLSMKSVNLHRPFEPVMKGILPSTQVQFSLALPRIMFYAKNTTWRSSWLEKMQENLDKVIHLSMPVTIDNFLLSRAWPLMFMLFVESPDLDQKTLKKNINPNCEICF